MKRFISLILCAVLCVCACSCAAKPQPNLSDPAISEEDTIPKSTDPVDSEPEIVVPDDKNRLDPFEGKSIKILAIGNSYSQNAMTYLYEILKAEGFTEVVLGNLVIGGCSLATHLDNAMYSKEAYEYKKCSGNKKFSSWRSAENISLQFGLGDEEWDIVTLQQFSGLAGSEDSLNDLATLIAALSTSKPEKAKYYWHMTWAYQNDYDDPSFDLYERDQATMYSAICNATRRKILTNNNISAIIPSGTAIQNARAVLGDTLSTDGSHMNEKGQFILGYTWYAAITGKELKELKYVPTELKLSNDEKTAIINAVNNAITNSFETA